MSVMLALKILDLALLGYQNYLAVRPRLEALRERLKDLEAEGDQLSDADWDILNSEIDNDLAELEDLLGLNKDSES